MVVALIDAVWFSCWWVVVAVMLVFSGLGFGNYDAEFGLWLDGC